MSRPLFHRCPPQRSMSHSLARFQNTLRRFSLHSLDRHISAKARRALLAACHCLGLLLILGFTLALQTSQPSAPPAVVITMTDHRTFVPNTVTITAGQTVEWHNTSHLVHTVTGDPARAALPQDAALPPGAQPFHSGPLQPGAAFRHTFTVPGTYKYFCMPHEASNMTGQVHVTPAPPR